MLIFTRRAMKAKCGETKLVVQAIHSEHSCVAVDKTKCQGMSHICLAWVPPVAPQASHSQVMHHCN